MYLFVIDPNRPPIIIAILDSVRKLGKKILEHAIRNDMNKAIKSLIKSVSRIFLFRTKFQFCPRCLKKCCSIKKWSKLTPTSTGINFYDNWFDNYYSLYEQTCNFLSYTDSVKLRCPGTYIPFYFSKESIQNLKLVGAGYMLDFIVDNNVAISKNDCHLNDYGHQIWSDHIYNYIKKLKNA